MKEGNPEELPEFFYEMPDNLSPPERLHLRAQKMVQAAFHCFGDPDMKPGTMTLEYDQIIETLAFAIAMLTAADAQNVTKKDFRTEVERVAKFIQRSAIAMRNIEDKTGVHLMDILHMQRSNPN